jgi:hypothetical protein
MPRLCPRASPSQCAQVYGLSTFESNGVRARVFSPVFPLQAYRKPRSRATNRINSILDRGHRTIQKSYGRGMRRTRGENKGTRTGSLIREANETPPHRRLSLHPHVRVTVLALVLPLIAYARYHASRHISPIPDRPVELPEIDASPSGIESESPRTAHIMADPATEPNDDRMQLALRGDRAVPSQPQLPATQTRFRDLFQRFCPWMIRQISHRLRDSRATDLSSVK